MHCQTVLLCSLLIIFVHEVKCWGPGCGESCGSCCKILGDNITGHGDIHSSHVFQSLMVIEMVYHIFNIAVNISASTCFVCSVPKLLTHIVKLRLEVSDLHKPGEHLHSP